MTSYMIKVVLGIFVSHVINVEEKKKKKAYQQTHDESKERRKMTG